MANGLLNYTVPITNLQRLPPQAGRTFGFGAVFMCSNYV